MAIVIFFGLFTSTLLNMIVVPSAYYRFGGITGEGAQTRLDVGQAHDF